MATRRQIAAAKRNIRKALAARKGKTRRKAARRDNPATKRRRTAGTVRRTTRMKRRSNPVEILEANPTKKRGRKKARRRVVSRKRAVYVKRGAPRSRKKQSIVNVHIVAPKRRAAAKRRTTKRRATRRRKTARRRTTRIAGLLPPARLANPVELQANPARKSRKRRKARRRSGSTQVLRARRNARLIKLVRNPITGEMGLSENPTSYGYDDNPMHSGAHMGGMRIGSNPLLGNGYEENAMSYEENPGMLGAFSGENIKKYGVAAGGVALGLVVADFIDRYVATRKPMGETANHPWYGRDAAAVYRSKPDAMRLGVQAVGAGGSLFLAYQLRNKAFAPWLFGGLALGFGVNLIKMLADWWLMPAIFSVKEEDAGKMSLGNRLYPLEQAYVQTKVGDVFKNWADATKAPADLQAAQTKDSPTILGPLSSDNASVYTLGNPNSQPRLGVAAPGTFRSEVSNVGRVGGRCGTCGGDNGCYAGCPASAPCPGGCPQAMTQSNGGGNDRRCEYSVPANAQPSDFYKLASAVGVSVADVVAMNNGQTPEQFFAPGSTAILPGPMCWALMMAENKAKEAVQSQKQAQSAAQAATIETEVARRAAEAATTSTTMPTAAAMTQAVNAQVSALSRRMYGGLGETPARSAGWAMTLGEVSDEE